MTITDTDDRMALLAADASYHRPRLFALYGLPNNPESPEILGWGMDFESEGETIFYLPDGETHHAGSPKDLQHLFALIADIRLVWLDDA